MPSFKPSRMAATSALVRSGGAILKLLSNVRRLSSVSRKWCGHASPVTLTPSRFAPADQIDAAGRRDVLDVNPAAGDLGQLDVAEDMDLLGHGRHAADAQGRADEALVHHAAARQVEVFAVVDDRLVEHPAVFERPPHDLGDS